MRVRQALVTSILVLGVVSRQVQAIDAVALNRATRQSLVLLVTLDDNSQPIALASGFFVGDGHTIATNLHVIESGVTVRVTTASGESFDVTKVSGIDVVHDLVLLAAGHSGPPLRLASREPEVGEEIMALGNPNGLEGTISTGVVSGIRKDAASTFYQISASISPGSSGGPVVRADGAVIGVSTFFLKDGQNLNFAVPARYIAALLHTPEQGSLLAAGRLRSALSEAESTKEPTSVAGTWSGVLTQEAGGVRSTYGFLLELRQNGSNVVGYSVIVIVETKEYGVMNVIGTVSEDSLEFHETGVLDQKRPGGRGLWCIKSGILVYDKNHLSLDGQWSAWGCPPGTIHLTRWKR